MGQKFTVGHLTAAMLNAIGQPVAGVTIDSAGATSGTTEAAYATSQIFTPDPSTWYLFMSTLTYVANANAAADGYWHRLRLNTVGGTELVASRLDVATSVAGPYSDMIGRCWFSGSTPSATQILGTLARFSGDGTLTPDKSSVLVFQLGPNTQFI